MRRRAYCNEQLSIFKIRSFTHFLRWFALKWIDDHGSQICSEISNNQQYFQVIGKVSEWRADDSYFLDRTMNAIAHGQLGELCFLPSTIPSSSSCQWRAEFGVRVMRLFHWSLRRLLILRTLLCSRKLNSIFRSSVTKIHQHAEWYHTELDYSR